MNDRNKKLIFVLLIVISTVILVIIGGSFAYFSTTTTSAENAITVGAASFALELEDDTSLIKNNLIPSIERYVDLASSRVSNGDFIKPYEDPSTGKLVVDNTACIDDNLNDICSIYTFTVINRMTTSDIPLQFSLIPSINTFENLYIKVLDNDKQIIQGSKLQIIDDRYQTELSNGAIRYKKDNQGDWIKKDNFDELPVPTITIPGINVTLPKATKDPVTNEVVPSTLTFSIVMWIMETGTNQNDQDSNKMFASKLQVSASGSDGQGITGVIAVVGNENP